jgi:phage repressor protein C with HTH and peptisase S24 domain
MIHAATLSNVADKGNMICSVTPHKMLPMDDLDLDSPGGRLRWAREQAGFKQAVDFAKRYSFNPTSYRAYENNQNGFSKKAHEFGDKLGVSGRWLLEGGEIEAAESEVSAIDGQARQMGLALIPDLELGYSMGGGSIFNDYRQRGFVPFQREWLRGFMRGTFADLFVARGEGDSMLPTLLDGDIVLIDTAQKQIDRQDRIWAISYGDLGMIKRVRRLPNGVYRITSDNPVVEPIEVADDEMHVVGRVVWVGRTM